MSRLRAMVDVLSTRLQEIYSRWETRGLKTHQSGVTPHLQQIVNIQRNRKKEISLRNKEAVKQSLERQLFQIKEADWTPIGESQPRPFVGLSCTSCTPSSRNSLIDRSAKNASLIDVLQVESLDNHPDGILAKIFPHIAHSVTFQAFPFPYIYDTVLKNERLQEILKDVTTQALEESKVTSDESAYSAMYRRQQERAVRLLKGLRSTFSDFILRLGAWVMTKVMSRLFTSVVVHPAHIDMLKKASTTGLPLVFIPLHRSHFDYIVITYILCYNNIRSPLVAAGENLRIPVFGWLLRGLGAFFIKRKIAAVQGRRDILYRAILHTYMTECLRAGHNFEFFIEGGRTRSGKPCMPKGGLLSVFVDAYIDGTIEDALLVPVSINYEKLVDGNFVHEQMGEPKQMESFGTALKGIWNAFTSHYGIMRVDFNQPFSLRELVKSFQSKLVLEINNRSNSIGSEGKTLHTVPSSASLYGTDVVIEEHRQLVDCIARHIVYDCCRTTSIMSTNAVSFLLLNAYRNGVKLDTLVSAVDSLRQELHNMNRDMGFSGETIDVVNHALHILGPALVKRERDVESGCVMIRPITMLPNVIELSYYSNCVIPHFILEAVVATALKSLMSEGSTYVKNEKILEQAQLLCDILQFEFLFTKTCQNLENVLSETIDNFVTTEILTQEQKLLTEEEQQSMRVAAQFDNFEEENEYSHHSWEKQPPYQVNKNSERYKLYSFILVPFLDVYSITARNLHRFVSQLIPERDFIKVVLNDIKVQLDAKIIHCGESVSVDTIRNAMKLFERWNVLECHTKDKIKVYYLKENYDNESSIESVWNRIKQFR
ncbi:glycerol-3-phosphate acyltransferase mino isoform X2 [Lycorma delicatula]|uniref:glycerol-3-phosphate acyltransferase mino isoform X2 n=1 Tax=Lycorma delicatula TaxID=130591 RepID=UPI003F5165A7